MTPSGAFARDRAWLPAPALRLRDPEPPPVSVTPELRRLTETLAAALAARSPARA